MKTLETHRLQLEPLLPEHADLLPEDWLDPELHRFIERPIANSREELRARYERLLARRSPDGTQIWLNWIAKDLEREEYVTTVEVTIYDDRTANLAYVTLRKYWRRGYSKEACSAVIRHISEFWPVDKFNITMDTRNLASRALAEALGGKLVEAENTEEYCYEILVSEERG